MLGKIQYKSKDEWLKLRAKNINSTETAALFKVSPYLTPFELWHQKKNQTVVTISENERMTWGNRLEAAIAEQVIDDNSWTGYPLKDYWQDTELRIGSSFDYSITEYAVPGLLEIKNVDGLVFRDSWGKGEDGNIMAPPHIELQVQHQLMVSGYQHCYLAALVGGNRLVLLKRTRGENVIDMMKIKIADFWQSIDDNNPPEPNFCDDYDFIYKLFSYAEKEDVLEITGACEVAMLAERYREGAGMEKAGKLMKSAAKAEVLTIITTSGKVKHENFTISSTPNKNGVRAFRINFKD